MGTASLLDPSSIRILSPAASFVAEIFVFTPRRRSSTSNCTQRSTTPAATQPLTPGSVCMGGGCRGGDAVGDILPLACDLRTTSAARE